MATLVLDNTLYQGYATIAEQNNISVTDAMAEALRLLKHDLRSEFLNFEICRQIGIMQVPLPYHQKHVIILRRLFHLAANHYFRD